MITALRCSFAALIGVVIARLIMAQSLVTDNLPTADGKRARIEIEGGVSGVWFVIERINKSDPNGKGFDPSQTYMISEFRPTVKPLKNSKFLIQFTCNICEDLP
jgi:hypothetical protein